MPEFLVFQLYGAMAAWGDIAVGEQRPTTSQPSKSAILGLLAAALGIQRHAEAEHQSLAAGYGFAVRVDAAGVLLRDYHTTQNIKNTNRLKHLYTRYDELADKDNTQTILSSRDYRCDGLYTVCLWRRDIEPESSPLTIVKAALHKPYFPLYLGRKSCPLALPIMAQIYTADTLEAAFSLFDAQNPAQSLLATLPLNSPPAYYWEADMPTQLVPLHSTPRTDQPLSRQRRQFAKRIEYYGKPQGK